MFGDFFSTPDEEGDFTRDDVRLNMEFSGVWLMSPHVGLISSHVGSVRPEADSI